MISFSASKWSRERQFAEEGSFISTNKLYNFRDVKLAISLILILVLNTADLFFTLMILKSGTMKEGNPLAVFLYSRNPLYLIGVKVFAGIFFVSLIWCLRRRVSPKIIKGSIIVVLVFYLVLIAYHLQCLSIIPYLFLLKP